MDDARRDDRRRPPRAPPSAPGLPEATVYGVSTFYDDLLAPRGARHVRVCTGTACFAATGDAHVDAAERRRSGSSSASAPPTARVSLAETVCLGFCHSSPAVRDGDVDRRRAAASLERVLAGRGAPARRSPSGSPCSTSRC